MSTKKNGLIGLSRV